MPMVVYAFLSLREPWLVVCINVARMWYQNKKNMSNTTMDLPTKDKQLKQGFRERQIASHDTDPHGLHQLDEQLLRTLTAFSSSDSPTTLPTDFRYSSSLGL